jgi:hypothetical protein
MKQVSHKISKLIFEVSLTGDENQVKGLQSEIEQLISSHIAEALDQSLSLFAHEHVDFIIDKLEIDIGSFNLKTDQKKLFRTISEKVEEEIHKISKTMEAPGEYHPVKSRTKDISELELVFYILRNGHLPWWADFAQKVNVASILKQFIQKSTSKQIVQLKDQLVNPIFRKRLIHYLKEAELIKCIQILMPSFIRSNKEILETSKTSSLFKESFFDLVFELPNQKNSIDIQEITETLIELLLDYKISPKIVNLEALPVPKDMLSRLKSMQLSVEKTKNIKRKPLDSKEKSNQKKKRAEREKSAQTDNNMVDETENSIEIGNAGLVLMLSFLSRFFENIGIATSKGFNSVAEQHTAAYLLHYIATGNRDVPQEHELFFEKLLCGIEVDEVLIPYSEFKQSHLDEVEDLLKSVIENWKALKSSSPQTLQSAFLQRSGYLILRDDGAWSLHIERQTIDILLNKIPWTISIGRLPFSNMMIYTEW